MKRNNSEASRRGRRSRSRGNRGERELAAVLRAFGWIGARRGQQRAGVDQADVIDGPLGWHFEAKRTEKLNLWKAYRKAWTDCNGRTGKEPVVATRRNGSDWLAVVDLRVLLALIAAAPPDAVTAAWLRGCALERMVE